MFGYSLIERLAAYYEDGSDALRFEKRLGSMAVSRDRPSPVGSTGCF